MILGKFIRQGADLALLKINFYFVQKYLSENEGFSHIKGLCRAREKAYFKKINVQLSVIPYICFVK